jgi:hypothetical protein
VPDAAGRSLWLAAVWTGVGAAVVCATLAIVAVAIVWLPVAGATAHPQSALHAGLLTFLAALHGGVTVDGTAAAFLPLGLLVVVGVTAARAGAALGDTATELGEDDTRQLLRAALVQAVSFAAAALVAVPFAHLGTSHAPYGGVLVAAMVVFLLTGGVAFVRASALAGEFSARVPQRVVRGARAAAAGLLVYLAAGALLVAGSLALHMSRVETLSRQVGGGWGGVPILLLGVLAAPNAVVAGASYLAGPGFSVGAATHVAPLATTHGLVPAFPILGALPDGAGANPAAWLLVALTPLLAGVATARLCRRAASWRERFVALGIAALVAAVVMSVLAWQAGGAIGSGHLSAVGASPWQAGFAVAAELAVAGVAWFGATAAVQRWRTRGSAAAVQVSPDATTTELPTLVVVSDAAAADTGSGAGDGDEAGQLAG